MTTPPIFLIGYRGSGKTAVACHLSAQLGWPWLDADTVLEARLGRTVRQVFADEGEASFRVHESALLAELARLEHHIIATGGGVVLRPKNRDLLRRGRVVWLTADAGTLWQRIAADQMTADRRPDLTVGGQAEVEALLQARTPLYRACADLTVDTVGRPPEAIAAEALAGLQLGQLGAPC